MTTDIYGECVWTQETGADFEGTWNTKCGGMFQFEVDGPKENGMKFCCYCGGKLIEAPIIDPCTFCGSRAHDSSDCEDADESVDEHLNED